MKYYSIGIKLDDIIVNRIVENLVINKLCKCKELSGKMFKVVFWHVNLTEQDCKDFVQRNEHLLFEFNTKITKVQEDVWFLIGESKDDKFKDGRYRYDGDIINGLNEYTRIINHINKRDRKYNGERNNEKNRYS